MIILLSYNHRINVYCVKYMYIIYVCKHNALVKTSITRTFRLSEHPLVPMRSDKWLPTVYTGNIPMTVWGCRSCPLAVAYLLQTERHCHSRRWPLGTFSVISLYRRNSWNLIPRLLCECGDYTCRDNLWNVFFQTVTFHTAASSTAACGLMDVVLFIQGQGFCLHWQSH